MGFVLAGCATPVAPVAVDDDHRTGALASALDQLVRMTSLSVPDAPAVLLQVDLPRAGLRWRGSTGLGASVSPDPDGTLRIASNTKTFVAAALLLLHERGQVELDAPAARWLGPASRRALQDAGHDLPGITVRMLAQHTSGLRDHSSLQTYLAQVQARPDRRWTRAEQLALALADGPPLAPPGRAFHYSDTGYVLLGEIIENVTGEPLPAAVRRVLDFQALGLHDTWFESLEPTPPGAPPRLVQLMEGIDAAVFDASIDLYGGGGLVSTLADLARLHRAAVRGTLFTDEATASAMREPSAPSLAGGATAYGMGLARMVHAGLVCHGHGGFWGTDAWHCPAIDLTVTAAVTTTTGREALRAMTMDAIRLAARTSIRPDQTPARTPDTGDCARRSLAGAQVRDCSGSGTSALGRPGRKTPVRPARHEGPRRRGCALGAGARRGGHRGHGQRPGPGPGPCCTGRSTTLSATRAARVCTSHPPEADGPRRHVATRRGLRRNPNPLIAPQFEALTLENWKARRLCALQHRHRQRR